MLSTIAAIAPAVGALWLWESESPPEPPRTATTPSLDAPAAEPPAASEAERPSGPPEVSGVTDSNEVWRRLALGDRNGVLDFLQSARAVGGDTRPAERLAYDVLSAVRTSAAQSRAAATATPGAAAAEAYQRAEARLGSANRLEAARDPLGALGLLWEASDLYLQSLTEGPPNAPVPPATPESRTLVEGAVPTPPALPSSRAVVQSLPPESLPRTRTATAAAEREPSGERPRTPSDVEDVLEALDRYRSAFQARDVSRLMLVYPSLSADQVEQLQRTFDGMAAYDVDMRGTRVQVQGEVATADAVVVRRMTPRVGSEVSNEVETRFRLRRTGAGWVITGVTAP